MTVKTAISIDKVLLGQAQELAREMNVSRSKLVSLALNEFLRRREEGEITCKLNEAYKDFPPDEEDKENIRFSSASIAKILEDDEW